MTDGITVGLALAAGVVSVLVGLALAQWTGMGRGAPRTPAARPDAEPVAFLFRDRRLIDATGPARTLIEALPGEGDWAQLWTWLAQRFDEPQRLLELAAQDGTATLAAQGGLSGLRLDLQNLGSGLVRIEVVDPRLDVVGRGC